MKDRLYIFNPYLTEIQAKVLLATKIDDQYHILLDKTIFYPDGLGGQRGDSGTMAGREIIKSYEKDGRIYHVVNERIDSDQVLLKINWENRLHIMQQHTCQHLVSACFYRLYAIDTLSFHASADHITIDFDTDTIEERQVEEVENLANFIIQNNLDIKSSFPSEKDLESISFRREPKVEKDLRLIEIDGFDYAACGGTHLKKTGELGLIKITAWAKQNGKLRIFVKSGLEALEDYRIKNNIFLDLSEDLSANRENLLEKYQTFKDKTKALEEGFSRLKESYLDLLAKEIVTQARKNKNRLYVGVFDGLDFSAAKVLNKKLQDQDLILALYKYDQGVTNFSITVNGNVEADLVPVKDHLDRNFVLKAGGSKKLLQGLIISNDEDQVEKFFQEDLKNLL